MHTGRMTFAHLRVLTFNTHVGQAHRGLATLVRKHQPDIVCVQEAQSRRSKVMVRRVLRSRRWIKMGPGLGNPAGTLVYVRRSARFQVRSRFNRLVTPGPRTGMQPARYLSGGLIWDTVSKRLIDVTSAHTWAMGKGLLHANPHVRTKHIEQVRAQAAHHTDADHNVLHLAAGDWNEELTLHSANPPSARHIMRAADMIPAAVKAPGRQPLHIDEVFISNRPWVTVQRRAIVESGDPRADHPGVVVDLRIQVALAA